VLLAAAKADVSDALVAFERAAHLHDSAAAWNNLANARMKLGEREAAVHAAQRADSRARSVETRWLGVALSTLADVSQAAPWYLVVKG